MKKMLLVLFLLAALPGLVLAQGPPGPPPGGGAAPGPAVVVPGPTGEQGPHSPVPFVIATLDFMNSLTITVKKEDKAVGFNPMMDFHRSEKTFVGPNVKPGDRVLVVYQNAPGGQGYDAKAMVKCPIGSDPQDLMKKLPQQH